MSYEANGKQISEETIKAWESKIIIKGSKIVSQRRDKENSFESESTFVIDPTKKPKTLDYTVMSGESKGNESLAIYEIDGDTWKTCWTFFSVDRAAYGIRNKTRLRLDTYHLQAREDVSE